MHLRHFNPILPQLIRQFRRVQLTVTPPRLGHLALLLERKVLPREAGPDVPFEQLEDFVVADGARVGEVVDARLIVGGQHERAGEQVVEDGVGVGNVHDTRVLRDLGHE